MSQFVEQAAKGVKHVIVVGGGFAGVNCALKVAKNSNVQVTLFDKNNYQQFQPLLYQVANAILAPSNIAFNLRAGVKKYPNIDVRLAEVVSVDLNSHTVRTADREPSRTATLFIPFRMPSGCARECWPCWNRRMKTHRSSTKER